MRHLPLGFKQFLTKLGVFAFLFILITGIIGSQIIPTKLLYGYHFFIYANIGKLMLFSVFIFFLFTKDTIKKINDFSYPRYNIGFVIASLLSVPIFLYFSSDLLKTQSFTDNLTFSIGMHAFSILMVISLIIGVFTIPFLRCFVKKYKKELIYCLLIGIVYYFAIFQVWKLWSYFSDVVLRVVQFLLSLSFTPVIVVPPRTLFVDGFSVAIAEACSGVESMFLFSTLYLLIGIIERQRINKKKFILFFFPAVLGLFVVNILRVYLLLLIGIFFSPEVMMGLFHSYLGMVLFIIYFLVFLRLGYARIKK